MTRKRPTGAIFLRITFASARSHNPTGMGVETSTSSAMVVPVRFDTDASFRSRYPSSSYTIIPLATPNVGCRLCGKRPVWPGNNRAVVEDANSKLGNTAVLCLQGRLAQTSHSRQTESLDVHHKVLRVPRMPS